MKKIETLKISKGCERWDNIENLLKGKRDKLTKGFYKKLKLIKFPNRLKIKGSLLQTFKETYLVLNIDGGAGETPLSIKPRKVYVDGSIDWNPRYIVMGSHDMRDCLLIIKHNIKTNEYDTKFFLSN